MNILTPQRARELLSYDLETGDLRWRMGGRHVHLDQFCTPEAAHSAYVRAKRGLHPFADMGSIC